MLALPHSIDPYLIQDQLLTVLKQSPVTEQLISMRAVEIVQSILQKPIIQKLQIQIKTLNQMIDEEKRGKRVLRSQSKKKMSERDKEVNNREQIVRRMQKIIDENEQKIGKLEQQYEQLTQELMKTQNTLDLTNNRNQALQSQLQQVRKQLLQTVERQQQTMIKFKQKEDGMIDMISDLQKSLSQQQSKGKQKDVVLAQKEEEFHRHLADESTKMQLLKKQKDSEIAKRDRDIQLLKAERFSLKNQINGFKIDVEDLGTALALTTREKEGLASDCLKLKESIRSSKSHFEKERKLLNSKLFELSKTSKSYRKLKLSFKQVVKNMSHAREQFIQFKKAVTWEIEKMSEEVNKRVLATLDYVGEQVGSQIEMLSLQLKTQAEQIRLARAQIKLKEQAMDISEKQWMSESKESIELKNELKMRKREQQRLRRELKKSYDQSEHRFSVLEKKYYDLLNGL